MLALLTVFLLMLAPPQQEQRFTPVEGAGLQAKHEEAARQAAAAGQSRFWTAHAFDVRPGVAVDIEFVSGDGHFFLKDGTFHDTDWDGPGLDPSVETRHLGVFLLREGARGEVVRVEVYNLARRREYAGHPVYWAGRASNEESLGLLRGLVESGRSPELAAAAVRAIALHDDRRVPEILTALARASTDWRVRAQAVRSLGHQPPAPGVREFLAALARDSREPTEVRRAAITAYGRFGDAQALSFLQGLYDSLTDRELKRRALSALRGNENRDAAVGFLVRVATQDADREMRKKALAQLGELAGERALGTLRETATSPDADVELQKQALAAISRRPAAEAVPLLIKVAQTHARPEVRKHALILLGRTGDPAAVEYLRGFLTR
ncbi:MAG TPA: HEAT repeat domain-containing protein [Pyrinomonadaceae bacterium]|nr:HEAT repeat domain-containing protein [Pyrinomonadaceae bacterium]